MNALTIDSKIVFKTIELKSSETYKVSGNEIITVVSGKVKDRIKGVLNTFESSVYYSGTLEAQEDSLLTVFTLENKDIVLNKIDVDGEFGGFCRKNWKQLREIYDLEGFEKVDLYRGEQMDYEFNGEKYKFNLWFCGKEIDCLWHNQHDFIETHTNVAGDGYMQKSLDGTDNGLIETVGLLPGNSHRKFNIEGEKESNGNPKYPFHRWLGGTTGNIWLVIEKI